jgi:glutathione S-transferase
VLIAQTANILLYLAHRHGLAPRDEVKRLWAHQLQLTIADVVDEAHDTHHPIAASLYYEDQQGEAHRRSADFIANRIPKYLGYFERVLERNPQGDRSRRTPSQLLRSIAVPASRRPALCLPGRDGAARTALRCVAALHDRIAERPRLKAYLKSGAPYPVQRIRHLSPLPGTRCCGLGHLSRTRYGLQILGAPAQVPDARQPARSDLLRRNIPHRR